MLVGYLILKRFVPLYTIPLVLLIGVAISLSQGSLRLDGIDLEMAPTSGSPTLAPVSRQRSWLVGRRIPLPE